MTSLGKIAGGVAIAALAAAFAVGEVSAQEKKVQGKSEAKGPNVDPKKKGGKVVSPVQDVATAHALVRYGDRNKDAMALISAARILNAVGAQDKQPPAQSKAANKATKEGPDMTVKGILARAKQYAGDRKDLLALADDAATGTRGPVEGPLQGVEVAGPNQRVWWNIAFRGDEPAVVAIHGDGDTDLDLFVYDENGRLVCQAVTTSDREQCGWYPRWTGMFRVEVRNLGRVANRFGIGMSSR